MSATLERAGGGRVTALRPYQAEARDAVLRTWREAADDAAGALGGTGAATLCVMPTGSGKTEVALAALLAEREDGRLGRALWLTHRRDLALQAATRAGRHFPALGPAGLVMADDDEAGAPLVCATMQTLAEPERLRGVLAAGPVTHLVIDEAHHAPADSVLAIVAALRADCRERTGRALRICGLTATPRRTDGLALGAVFGGVCYRMLLRDGVRLGALVPFRSYAVGLGASYRDLPLTAGLDYEPEAAGRVLSHARTLRDVVAAYVRWGEGRPALAFTASVRQAHALAGAFEAAGVAARALDGTSGEAERREAYAGFRAGAVRLLANCALINEGIDLPEAACLLQVRPTRSDAAYLQMLGRVLRPAPGKADALVLDFVPKDARDLAGARDVLGGRPRAEREAMRAAERAGVLLDSRAVLPDGSGLDAEPDALRIRMLADLGRAPLAWTFDGVLATASLAERVSAAVVVADPGPEYTAYLVEGAGVERLGAVEAWPEAVRLVAARAEPLVRPGLALRRMRWRRDPASEGQARLLRRFGRFREDMTKGEAAQLITHHFTRGALREAVGAARPALERGLGRGA